jgi:hypothetical protein
MKRLIKGYGREKRLGYADVDYLLGADIGGSINTVNQVFRFSQCYVWRSSNFQNRGLKHLYRIFISGFCVLLRVLSRLLQVPPLTTTFEDVYSYIPATATCFGPVGHLQVNIQLIAGSYCSYSRSVLL